MKTIGLLGGMSWESSLDYYRLINTFIREQLGGLNSAKIVLYSVNFEEIETLQRENKWDEAAAILAAAAKNIEAGGADFLLICTNTMHLVADQIQQAISIPLIHIADATAETLIARNIKTVGLLGTAFTMQKDFYKGRLRDQYKLNVITPSPEAQQIVHRIIYDELCCGIISQVSRIQYQEIIAQLSEAGAEGVILGCTEIGLLIKQHDTPVPLFDTTVLHAQKAVQEAIQ